MRTIDPLNLPTSFKISEARTADLGEHPRLLDGLLYLGLTVLFSEPGLGKSMMAAAIEEHLAYGRPFGPWLPEQPVRSLVVDLEGDMRLAAERSLANTPFGLLASDHGHAMPADIEYETVWRGTSFLERIERLAERLETALQAGDPYGYVRIDTMRLFMGSKPHGANAYEWDAHCLGQLNKLALHYRVALVLVHHTNKGGEVSGSTGVAGSATAVIQLRRNPDVDEECLLVAQKVRVDAMFRYAVAMDPQGRWHFTDEITPTQAQLAGVKRQIVDILTAGGATVISELLDRLPAGLSRNTVKSALRRLSSEGHVRYRRGAWELSQTALAELPQCAECGGPMIAFARGQKLHPTCGPSPFERETVRQWLGVPAPSAPVDDERPAGHDEPRPAPVPAPRADEDDEFEDEPEEDFDEHPEAQKFPSWAQLKASISVSRMKPLPRVDPELRGELPWTLITEHMDGQHSTKAWSRPIPEGTQYVVILDRNGSFPSAMSSVALAPNKLVHTGALGTDPLKRGAQSGRAGIYQVRVPEWPHENIPHPMGRLSYGKIGELVWIGSPHMEHLDKLAGLGLLPLVEVHDSYTGNRNCSLFERYSSWARTLRQGIAGEPEEVRTAAKRSISTAIRGLHPKKSKSPFWRPDWHKAVTAEASIRHWETARRAVEGGAVLLSIGATDEVVFAVPADAPAPKLWVPTPYRIGYGFGEVKHKEITLGRGEGAEKVMSPVTVEQYLQRGRRGVQR